MVIGRRCTPDTTSTPPLSLPAFTLKGMIGKRKIKGGKRKHASYVNNYTTGPRVFAQPLNEVIIAVTLETLKPAGHTNEQTHHLNYCNQSHEHRYWRRQARTTHSSTATN